MFCDRIGSDGPVTFTIQQHSKDLVCLLTYVRRNSQLFDVRLKVEEVVINAHRIVLCACSNYFRKMFLCGMVESTSDEIHIQNVDSRIMQLIVDYAYTGEILISSQNVERLLAASVLLQVQAVTASCCTFLGNKMTPLNCMAIARFATTHASPECQALWEKAVEYSFTRFSEVSKSDDFLQLPEEELVQILTNERLFTRVRMSAYSTCCATSSHIYVVGGYDGENIMSSVERYDPLTDTWSLMSPMPVPVSGLACTAVCPDIIFAFGVISVHILGGYNGREFVNHLQIYNIESDQWRNQPTDNFGRTGHGVIVGGRPQIIHQLVFVDYCRMRGQNIYYMCGSIK
ncbi:kelch-like protein 12 [Octopus sinensis]|uniref:Kelch-like protein 12 n=1 Tax=Octopus sinensis TaxID=2607531 RepID=A0A6P7U0E1_9MOLL|nr:kelch-like protein 12 [Octopus sinensis]XP_036356026.1 kelch-like protein 12 [Octopus sinensis]